MPDPASLQRVAILGVGLVGGSVALAAKKRLGVEVAGFDPDPAIGARAAELGVIDRSADGVADAVAGAEVIFCAAPVAVLPGLVSEALEHSGPDAVISDVGSTKRELVGGLDGEDARRRFIGGHPLAGAESAGVENSRAELFEGARWYLTPTDGTDDILYHRLQRLVSEIGARPQAIDPETHDLLMATVSHLPHVLANALVGQAAQTLAERSERLPEVGPSFRDTTRVAGANPAIWNDIFASNADAVADSIDEVIARLTEASRLIRERDREGVEAWHQSAREDRRLLLEGDASGGVLHQLQIGVENKPGTVAEIALALGRESVNIEDMALFPSGEARSGGVTLWIAGREEAERAAGIVQGLGHTVSVAAGGG